MKKVFSTKVLNSLKNTFTFLSNYSIIFLLYIFFNIHNLSTNGKVQYLYFDINKWITLRKCSKATWNAFFQNKKECYTYIIESFKTNSKFSQCYYQVEPGDFMLIETVYSTTTTTSEIEINVFSLFQSINYISFSFTIIHSSQIS